jgi:hypothetical protein
MEETMLRVLTKTTFAVMAISCLFCAPASAKYMEALKVSPNANTLGGPVIEVESDGETWTHIKPGSHQLDMHVDIEAGSGWRVTSAYIGVPSADFGGTGSQTDAVRFLGGGKDTKSIKRNVMHSFHTDDLGLDVQAIVNACNDGNHPATEQHTTFADVNVGIKAFFQTRRDAKRPQEAVNDAGRSETAYARAPVTVSCLAGPTHVDAPPKPVSVDIRVNQNGNSCPKDAEVTAFIDYDEPMTARFRVIHNGDEPTSDPIEIKAREVSFAGKTWYRVERLERYKLDPGSHSFQIKVMGGGLSPVKTVTIDCPPFKVTSAWLAYEVENKDTCPKQVTETATIYANRPGDAPYRIETQGGLVVTQGIAYAAREGDKYVARRTRKVSMGAFDQMMRLVIVNDPSAGDQKPLKVECLEALSGKLTLQSLGATSCQGEALVAIHTNGAGELPYELECGPGKSWQRKVTAMANKIGVDKVRFDVTNNEQVTCVLRTRIGGVLKPLDGASMTFQCHKPTGVSGSDDLAPDTRPEDPPLVHPTLTGDFSFVDNGGTKCPRQGKALINFKTSKPDNVHYSLDCTNGHFSGVAQTAPSPQGGFIAPALVLFDVNQTTHANCVLKTVAPGTPKVHTLKGHTFQCVTPTGVGGSDDLAPDTRPDPKDQDKPGLTVVDPKINCTGGTVKDGACVCERTHNPVKAGKNAWRCVQSVVDPKPLKPTVAELKISCAGGTVKNGACTCARTQKPVKAGNHAWRCIKAVIDPPKTKDGADKLKVKTAPNKPAIPKLGVSGKPKGDKGNSKAARNGNGSSAAR